MKKFRALRVMLLALFVCLVPALSFGEVFISVNFAPPVLPVYEQPVCPQDGWMWTPGYWAYDYNIADYYWVPGAWVPAPEVGMLWTPGYWGFASGAYVWYPGYWGPHVGYYGGVNYGFGYMGIGFAGGEWRGGVFAYNEAVVHVDRTIVHTTYVDRTIVERNTIVNDRHVAFSGGPGGINHPPSPEENAAMHEQHVAPTSAQTQHASAAIQDRASFSKNNGGHPATTAVARPLTPNNNPAPGANRGVGNNGGAVGTGGNATWGARQTHNAPPANTPGNNEGRTYNSSHSNTANTPAPPPPSRGPGGFSTGAQVHGNAQPAPPPAPRPAPAPAARPAPAPAPRPAPAPAARPAPKPESHEKER